VGTPPIDLSSLRDLIPFAVELGIELLEADPEIAREDGRLAAKVTQTQIYHYPSAAQ
jgi:hypothetical protein